MILFWSFYFYLSTNLERSILKHFFVWGLDDFFDIVELLLRCYFDLWSSFCGTSKVGLSARLLVTCCLALVMLIFLKYYQDYLEWCTVLCVLCGWYIFSESTFGFELLCPEESIDDFAGTFSWIDLFILLIKELTPEIVGFEVYYRAEVLGLEFFCLELFFMGNKYISIFVY